MKKSDLKSGMIVETRDGYLYLVIGDFIARHDKFVLLSNYNKSMLHSTNYSGDDIMKVYEYKNEICDNNAATIRTLFNKTLLTLLWERKEYELTKREIEILKALKTLGYEWLSRDKDGELYAYITKPHKFDYQWNTGGIVISLKHLTVGFDFIKWSDEEPTKIDDLLKEIEK